MVFFCRPLFSSISCSCSPPNSEMWQFLFMYVPRVDSVNSITQRNRFGMTLRFQISTLSTSSSAFCWCAIWNHLFCSFALTMIISFLSLFKLNMQKKVDFMDAQLRTNKRTEWWKSKDNTKKKNEIMMTMVRGDKGKSNTPRDTYKSRYSTESSVVLEPLPKKNRHIQVSCHVNDK